MSIINEIFRNPSKNWHKYWIGMALYLATVFPVFYLARTYFSDSVLRYPLVTIPVIPALWGCWFLIQYVLEQDELIRKTHLEATLLAAVALCAFTLTYGFLESVGLPPLQTLLIFPLFMVLWSIAYFFTKIKHGV